MRTFQKAHIWDYVLEAYDYLKSRIYPVHTTTVATNGTKPVRIEKIMPVVTSTGLSGQTMTVLVRDTEASSEEIIKGEKRTYEMVEHVETVELPQDEHVEDIVKLDEYENEVTLTPIKQQKVSTNI